MQGAVFQPILPSQSAELTGKTGLAAMEGQTIAAVMSFDEALKDVLANKTLPVKDFPLTSKNLAETFELAGEELPELGEYLPLEGILPIAQATITVTDDVLLSGSFTLQNPALPTSQTDRVVSESSRLSDQEILFSKPVLLPVKNSEPTFSPRQIIETVLTGDTKVLASTVRTEPLTASAIAPEIEQATIAPKSALPISFNELKEIFSRPQSKSFSSHAQNLVTVYESGTLLGANQQQLLITPALSTSVTASGNSMAMNFDALAENILWMANQDTKTATIQLDPPELGQLQIRLSMDQDKVNVQFITQNLPAKEALDAAIPRLRDLFQSTGVDLVNVDVANQGNQSQTGARSADQQRSGLPYASMVTDEKEAAKGDANSTKNQASEISLHLIDDYV